MQEELIKSAVEEIKLSEDQKTEILHNVIYQKKKKRFALKPYVLSASAAIAVIGAIIIMPKTMQKSSDFSGVSDRETPVYAVDDKRQTSSNDGEEKGSQLINKTDGYSFEERVSAESGEKILLTSPEGKKISIEIINDQDQADIMNDANCEKTVINNMEVAIIVENDSCTAEFIRDGKLWRLTAEGLSYRELISFLNNLNE